MSHPPDATFPLDSRFYNIPTEHRSQHDKLKKHGVKSSKLFPQFLGLHAVETIPGTNTSTALTIPSPNGKLITYYEGVVMWLEEYIRLPFHCGTAVSLELKVPHYPGQHLVIVGYPDSPCAIINDPRGSGTVANCRLVVDESKANIIDDKIALAGRYIAIRSACKSSITAGTELTVDYGQGFFMDKHVYCYWCSMKLQSGDEYKQCTLCKNYFHQTSECLKKFILPGNVNWICPSCRQTKSVY